VPFTDGGAVLSIVSAVAGGACCLAALWNGAGGDPAGAIARAVLGNLADAADLVSAVPLAAVPVLGIAATALGVLSRRRIRNAGAGLSGGGLALVGIGAGIALLVVFGMLAAGTVSDLQVDIACGGSCMP
jgi:hypothetical protein